VAQPILWAGVDAGKVAHHCVVIDADGQRVLSRRVVNDEAALIDLIRAVKELAGGGSVRWAIDLNSGGAALLITLLLDDEQELLYIPGRTVHHASGAYRGDGKTDAKDAAIIADQSGGFPRSSDAHWRGGQRRRSTVFGRSAHSPPTRQSPFGHMRNTLCSIGLSGINTSR
jgi:hypothetical protein